MGLRRERVGGEQVAEITNTRIFATVSRAPRPDAARAPARLGRGEGVARCFVGQCVGKRDQSCGGFEVLQRYEPFERSSSHFPFGNTKQPMYETPPRSARTTLKKCDGTQVTPSRWTPRSRYFGYDASSEAVFLSFWKKQRPRDDVDLVGDASDAPAELLNLQPRAAIQQASCGAMLSR